MPLLPVGIDTQKIQKVRAHAPNSTEGTIGHNWYTYIFFPLFLTRDIKFKT